MYIYYYKIVTIEEINYCFYYFTVHTVFQIFFTTFYFYNYIQIKGFLAYKYTAATTSTKHLGEIACGGC